MTETAELSKEAANIVGACNVVDAATAELAAQGKALGDDMVKQANKDAISRILGGRSVQAGGRSWYEPDDFSRHAR